MSIADTEFDEPEGLTEETKVEFDCKLAELIVINEY